MQNLKYRFLYTIDNDLVVIQVKNNILRIRLEDLPKLVNVTLGMCKQYVRVSFSSKSYLLHRYLLDLHDTSSPEVDHEDGNTLNNVRSNLRICQFNENNQNRSILNRNNKTGIRGVFLETRTGLFVASVGKTRLGRFKDISSAEEAVKAARARLMPFSKEIITHV